MKYYKGGAKRTSSAKATIAKRLKRVEIQSRRNKPEVKSITFSASSASLAAGSLVNVVANKVAEGSGTNERIGDQIHLVAISVRGYCDPDLDAYLIKLHTTSEPTAAVFTSGFGAFILDADSGARFNELYHYRNTFLNDGTNTSIKMYRKLGYNCYFNGSTSTSAIRGQICVTILNRDVAAKGYNFSVRLWYTDA